MIYTDIQGTRYRVVKKTFADGSQFYYVQYTLGWLSCKLNMWNDYSKAWDQEIDAIKDIEGDIRMINERVLSKKIIKEEIL